MDILFTGYVGQLTNELVEPFLVNHKVVVAAEDARTTRLDKRITPFNTSALAVDFDKLFSAHSFDVVIFLSQPAFTGTPHQNEYEKLANCLKVCDKRNVNKLIYVCTDYGFSDSTIDNTDTSLLLNSCRELTEYYRTKRSISTVTVKIPSMYGYGEDASLIGSTVANAKSKGSVAFHGAKFQTVGFISQKDVGELLRRITESWPVFLNSFSVPAGNIMTFQDLGKLIIKYFPTTRCTYTSYPTGSPAVELEESIAKEEFDWIPLQDLNQEMEAITKSEDEVYVKEKEGFFTTVRNFFNKHNFVFQMLEVVIGLILMELLNKITATTVQFRYVDFRLLYIVILATFHGLTTGLVAATLACISLLAASVTESSNWMATIYDIDTWLPFIFFYLVGSVTGYVRDRKAKDNENLKEEKALLEEKFVLLNDFYSSALVNKDRYKNQIISYRDSFGRLFDITKRLDSTLVEQVFCEALEALEGILSSKAICIYGCNEFSHFARLLICSKEISAVMTKSVDMSIYPEMTGTFRSGEDMVWVNRDRLNGYPEYAMPIYNDNSLVALITVQKAGYDQMDIYYENLIRIVGGLIKISLIRALEFTKQTERDMYLPDSHIMKPEYFGEIIKVRQNAKENGTSEYSIMRFDVPESELTRVGNSLYGLIRNTDYLGQGKDGRLYLCLNQASEKDVQIVLDRMQKAGLVLNAPGNGGT